MMGLTYYSGGYMCPVCGVISDIYPSMFEGDTTAVIQRFVYCGHKVFSEVYV